jgi:hypothetical protein
MRETRHAMHIYEGRQVNGHRASRKDWNSPFVGLSDVMLFDDLNYLVPIKLI